jgi:hypothetical protein
MVTAMDMATVMAMVTVMATGKMVRMPRLNFRKGKPSLGSWSRLINHSKMVWIL